MGTGANMVRSVVVICGLMAVLFFITARVNTVGGPPVDVAGIASGAMEQSGWELLEARDLPADWTITSARYTRSSSDLMTWHVGYQAPSGRYVAVEQTEDPTAEWIGAQTGNARRSGTLEAGGRTWEKFERGGKVHNSLLIRDLQPSGLTTLLTGTASFDEFAVVAERLTPIAATSR